MAEKYYRLEDVSLESGIKVETLKKRAQRLLTKRGRDWLFTEAEKMLIVRNGGRIRPEPVKAGPPEAPVVQPKVKALTPLEAAERVTEKKWWEKGPLPALPTKPKPKHDSQ